MLGYFLSHRKAGEVADRSYYYNIEDVLPETLILHGWVSFFKTVQGNTVFKNDSIINI